MESIELLKIHKNKNTVEYEYRFTSGLADYLTNQRFLIHYPVDVTSVPDSVLAIPFVSNLIQVAWITDSSLIVESIDKDFYDCLPKLRSAFAAMFPETHFGGRLVCENIEFKRPSNLQKVAMFYSGGVDSVQTFISHKKENIDLLCVWGSDIKYENEEGWEALYNTIDKSIEPFDLSLTVIHSSFRNVCDENALYRSFSAQLKDSWWHGIQHGLGLLGHAAPLAFLRGYRNFYIASTHSTHDKNVRCSSHPTTDNCVQFCGCQVVHDGFEFKRQDKIKNIVEFANNNPLSTPTLHVCWKTQSGENCCSCEKCARTIYAILLEGGNPIKFGFKDVEKSLRWFSKKKGLAYLNKHPHLFHAWFDIAERAAEKKDEIHSSKYWNELKWLVKVNRNKPKTYLVHHNPIKNCVRGIINKVAYLRANLKYKKHLTSSKGEKCIYLLGTPTHCNIGDAAIAQAEIDFLSSIGLKAIEITVNDWKRYKTIIKKNIKSDVILLHGGGNFGNLWPYEERMREDIVSNLNASHFVLLPQTFYLKTTAPIEEINAFKQKYNHSCFSLFAREKFSYEKMTQFFPNSNVFLTPDIVLFEKGNASLRCDNKEKETDVLLVLRNDRESIISYDEKESVVNLLKKLNLSFKKTDMLHTESAIPKEKRMQVIKNKLNEFARAKLVITDRLHGMIFAYLAGVSCIVLNNNNYKIKGVYEWIKDDHRIVMVEKIADIQKAINTVITAHNACSVDAKRFNNLKDEIMSEIKNATR